MNIKQWLSGAIRRPIKEEFKAAKSEGPFVVLDYKYEDGMYGRRTSQHNAFNAASKDSTVRDYEQPQAMPPSFYEEVDYRPFTIKNASNETALNVSIDPIPFDGGFIEFEPKITPFLLTGESANLTPIFMNKHNQVSRLDIFIKQFAIHLAGWSYESGLVAAGTILKKSAAEYLSDHETPVKIRYESIDGRGFETGTNLIYRPWHNRVTTGVLSRKVIE